MFLFRLYRKSVLIACAVPFLVIYRLLHFFYNWKSDKISVKNIHRIFRTDFGECITTCKLKMNLFSGVVQQLFCLYPHRLCNINIIPHSRYGFAALCPGCWFLQHLERMYRRFAVSNHLTLNLYWLVSPTGNGNILCLLAQFVGRVNSSFEFVILLVTIRSFVNITVNSYNMVVFKAKRENNLEQDATFHVRIYPWTGIVLELFYLSLAIAASHYLQVAVM